MDYSTIIADLESVYGKANSNAFGSAVFHGPVKPESSIDAVSLGFYKAFLGDRYTGERGAAWQSGWKKVNERPSGKQPGIMAELSAITDPLAKQSVPLMAEVLEVPEKAQKALATAFDHPDAQQVSIYAMGDGEAMNGLMCCGIFNGTYAIAVAALMD